VVVGVIVTSEIDVIRTAYRFRPSVLASFEVAIHVTLVTDAEAGKFGNISQGTENEYGKTRATSHISQALLCGLASHDKGLTISLHRTDTTFLRPHYSEFLQLYPLRSVALGAQLVRNIGSSAEETF
jgi:hypothetical protein